MIIDSTMKNFENILHKRSIKPTTMRLLVVQALTDQGSAISLSDLERIFEKSDRVTYTGHLKPFRKKGWFTALTTVPEHPNMHCVKRIANVN